MRVTSEMAAYTSSGEAVMSRVISMLRVMARIPLQVSDRCRAGLEQPCTPALLWLVPLTSFANPQSEAIHVAGHAAVSPHTVGQHRRPHDAGVNLQAARRAAPPPHGCAQHPHRADRRRGPRPADTFGGEVQTRRWTASLREGIAYNRFHTTAMCSPTRASILTGRNHHRVGNGQIAELANDWDGYCRHDPQEQRARRRSAQGLRLQHRAPSASGTTRRPMETTAAGPFENWPTKWASNISTDSWPARPRSTNRTWCAIPPVVLPPRTPEEGYHLSEDLADDAIGWLRTHKAFQPDKPFYMYWASGAIHGPHHIMKEWADKYKGKFDDGWDAYRERVFHRAKEKGWIPAERAAHAAAPNHGRLGQHPGGREALPAPPDGSGGRVCRARGCAGRPAHRRNRARSAMATTP